MTVDAQGHVSGAEAVTKEDITGLGIPGQDTTYQKATQQADGLMSKEDTLKLDGMVVAGDGEGHGDAERGVRCLLWRR